MKNRNWRLLFAIMMLAAMILACGGDDTTPPPDDGPGPEQPTEQPTEPPTEPPPDALFEDDFSDPGTGWEEWVAGDGSVTEYENGHYRISSLEPGWMVGAGSDRFSDTVIAVQATQILASSTNNNGYGVMCRVQADSSGYLFAVSGDGYYAIFLIVEGTFNELVAWTQSGAINQGNDTNQLRAVCDGTNLVFFVNGDKVDEVTDNTYSSGTLALAANTYEEGEPTEIHFDDLRVTEP